MVKFSEQKGDAICCPKNTTIPAIENAKGGWCCCCCCEGPTPKEKKANNSNDPDKAQYIKLCFCFSVKKRRVDSDIEGDIELPVKQAEQELEGGEAQDSENQVTKELKVPKDDEDGDIIHDADSEPDSE